MSDAELLDGTESSLPPEEDNTPPEAPRDIHPEETAAGEPALLTESVPLTVVDTRPPHQRRFRVTLVVLAGIALAAIVVAVAVAANGNTRDSTSSGAKWSAWAPSSGGSSAVSEIAEEVAPFYRQNTAKQLDVVTPIALTMPTDAGTTTGTGLTVAVDAGGASASASSSNPSSLELLGGKTVAYNVCGLGGKKCELGGKASTGRLLLLRREALELALYTFKYVSGTDNVIVVLPPGKTVANAKSGSSSGSSAATAPVTVAVLFVRQELQPWLNEPLTRTLAAYPPDLAELPMWSQTTEAGFVDQVTAHGLFAEQIQSQQEGGNLLVLTQLPAQ